MNKIVRSTSATPWSVKRSNLHVQTCNRCSDSACCRTPAISKLVERFTDYDKHGAYTVELTDISHWE